MSTADDDIKPPAPSLTTDPELPNFDAQAIAGNFEPVLATGSGRYQIGEEFARGGMGRVLLARDTNIDREVVMKVLLDPDASLPKRLRFTQEAQITGQLQHPNIVPIYDIGHLDDGQLFFTMKRVAGRTLAELLGELSRQRRDSGGRRDQGRIQLLFSFRQVCMGMAYAHSRGVVHRDLKPANIMIGDFGEVLVMDWGLAKVLATNDGVPVRTCRQNHSEFATRYGEVIGTPSYMPPELALGMLDDVDHRSDIYSLGAILYELLTMRPPFTGRNRREILGKVVGEEVRPPSLRAPEQDIPDRLAEIAMRCLAKDPDQRPESALLLHAVIDAYLEGAEDRERKAHTAGGHVESAHARVRVHQLLNEQLRIAEAAHGALAQVHPTAKDHRRQAVEKAKNDLMSVNRQVDGAFDDAERAYLTALCHDEDDDDARSGLCSLYWRSLLAAERQGDLRKAERCERGLRGCDLGSYTRRLEGRGRLSVGCDTPGAHAILLPLGGAPEQPEQPEQPESLGSLPVTEVPVEMGSHLLVVRSVGYRDTRFPVFVDRGGHVMIGVRLLTEAVIGADFIYIPGGEVPLGNDARASWALGSDVTSRHHYHVNDFLLARYPVTVGEYQAFLATLDLATAALRAPRTEFGLVLCPEKLDSRWPVFGVSHADAVAYCAWLEVRDGRPYRLPTEFEWEKGARGGDARSFPWGDTWHPSRCSCAESTAGPPAPQVVGHFKDDRSPYGVADLAGGVSEWTATLATESGIVCKGGAWGLGEQAARAASRRAVHRETASMYIGFRLALACPAP